MNTRSIQTLLLLAVAAPFAAAQAGASTQHFLAAAETGSGGTAQTSQYVLTAVLGPSPAAEGAFSGNHMLLGGFAAELDVTVTGRPWLTAVTPRFATMNGAAALTLHGTELDLGSMVALTVGGVAATAQTRTNAAIGTTLPPQPAPGWQTAEVVTTAGMATLARAVGVLPMIEAVEPIAPGRPGELVYRGRPGDFMVWGYAASLNPVPVPVAPLRYGLLLDFRTLATTGTSLVTSPAGEIRLSLPPFAAALPFYIQAAALSSDPGYAPGSFTNVIRIF